VQYDVVFGQGCCMKKQINQHACRPAVRTAHKARRLVWWVMRARAPFFASPPLPLDFEALCIDERV
jgi:hypothetical protein